MSDEYAASGYKGGLANPTIADQSVNTSDAGDTGNYPPEGDTTSSGGYGSATNIYSRKAQRGRTDQDESGTFTDNGPANDSGANKGEKLLDGTEADREFNVPVDRGRS